MVKPCPSPTQLRSSQCFALDLVGKELEPPHVEKKTSSINYWVKSKHLSRDYWEQNASHRATQSQFEDISHRSKHYTRRLESSSFYSTYYQARNCDDDTYSSYDMAIISQHTLCDSCDTHQAEKNHQQKTTYDQVHRRFQHD